ncbi:Hypothetical predicted protein [Olea europaea subsp. europaea]|uniref:Uncharacterized protein n=1 Tax=Olea europaea subsp. europaea TaxID=158383 RepID=A0A8S0TVW7_OLEEU|nr:Hypothetical predicted protein [Olea europaea subsp. europaea]
MEQIKKELETLKFEMNVKIVAIESRITMMEMVAAKPVSEKANMAIESEGPSANKFEGFYSNIEQEAFKLHNLSVKENTTLSPSSEKNYTKDSISIPELNRSNVKACNTPGVMDIKNKEDFILVKSNFIITPQGLSLYKISQSAILTPNPTALSIILIAQFPIIQKSTTTMCGTIVVGARILATSCATVFVYFVFVSCSVTIIVSDSSAQYIATSFLTYSKTLGCESKKATAHNKDEVDTSCDADKKSNK